MTLAVVAVPGRLRDRILLALFLALGLGLLGAYALTLVSGTIPPQKTDFINYYSAGRLVAEGHGAQLYNFAAMSAIERHVITPYRLTYGVLPYVYPPYFAVAVAPLSLLSLVPAYALWAALNAVWLCLALVTIQRRAGLRVQGTAALWLGAWTFIPTFIGLLHGQVSFLLLALLGAALLSLERRWDVLAGVLFAVGMLKPTYVLPCLVVLLVRRRWPALLSFLGASAVLSLVPILFTSPTINTAYTETLRRAMGWTTQFGYGPDKTASLAGPLRDILPSEAALVALVTLTVAALVGTAMAARRSHEIGPPFGLALLVGLLISPHVLIHDLVLLLIPVGIALQIRDTGPTWLPISVSTLYVLSILGLVLAGVLHFQLIILAMCVLAYWFVVALRSSSRGLRAA